MTTIDQQNRSAVDVSDEDIHWRQDMSYGSYLALDKLLSAQKPLSGAHDEMLFIVIHQASELWLKLCLTELKEAMAAIQSGALDPAFKLLSRVSRIQTNLEQSWEILSTMTPADYAAFRPSLGQSSGFQSFQYREMEYKLGNKNARLAEAHRQNEPIHQHLLEVLKAPSIYDLAIQHLAHTGFAISDAMLDRDYSEPYKPDDSVEKAWTAIYRDPTRYWSEYELAEKLVDLEANVQRWRFAHMTTVERIIGYAPGTGGTGGVSYLKKALDLRFFPELWSARGALIKGS